MPLPLPRDATTSTATREAGKSGPRYDCSQNKVRCGVQEVNNDPDRSFPVFELLNCAPSPLNHTIPDPARQKLSDHGGRASRSSR
jgi:hypothetical protein